jgi:E3 ubiquitin-protein ligase UBR4
MDQALLQQLGFGGAAAMAYVPYRGELDGPDGFGDLPTNDEHSERRRILTKQLEPYLNELLQVTGSSELPAAVVDILNSLLPSIERASKRLSPVGSLQRARRTLHQLHHEPKTIVASESLMIPTLGSQEGAFENVRMSFTGDQGQTIRQLLSAHVLRRVTINMRIFFE